MANLSATAERVLLRLRKRRVVQNALGRGPGTGQRRAFVYYKTDPVFSRALRDSYRHTNDTEIFEILRIFRQLGFVVDLVDREATWEEVAPLLKNEYAVYFANAAGNSAPLHARLAREIDAQCHIYYAAGPEPERSNALVHERHAEFDARTGRISVRRRILNDANYVERLHRADAIFFVGNEFSESTFQRICDLPMHRILPSTSPALLVDAQALSCKRARSFLYLGGNGLICKGLDLVLEAFDGLADLTLDIFAPDGEDDFWSYYRPLLNRNPGIRFHGFVDVNGPLFRQVTAATAFNVFPSCSEGCATSVITAMRRGVVPIATRESGVDLEDFGIAIVDRSVAGLRHLILQSSAMPEDQLKRRIIGAYTHSSRYSIDGFRNSFTEALLETLLAKHIL